MDTMKKVEDAIQTLSESHRGLFINTDRLFRSPSVDIHNKQMICELLLLKFNIGTPELKSSLMDMIEETNPTYDTVTFLISVLLLQQKRLSVN